MGLATAFMARKKPQVDTRRPSDGEVLLENLCRLGWCERVVKATDLASKVTETTGKNLSRQRVAQLLNAVRITDETIEFLAQGIGVDAAELRRWQGGAES